mmetsp:Transcript_18617/g.20838  ORF Transcript_18617/g.20838 Transcript_18617/m.20838 type:complete len:99 (-) Transcript_18617:92-388(-)
MRCFKINVLSTFSWERRDILSYDSSTASSGSLQHNSFKKQQRVIRTELLVRGSSPRNILPVDILFFPLHLTTKVQSSNILSHNGRVLTSGRSFLLLSF